MHLMDGLAETGVKIAIVLKDGGHFGEIFVLFRLSCLKVANHAPLLLLNGFMHVWQSGEFFDGVDQLFTNELGEGFSRSLSPVLLLEQLTIPHSLQCRVLGDVEPRANGCCEKNIQILRLEIDLNEL